MTLEVLAASLLKEQWDEGYRPLGLKSSTLALACLPVPCCL